MDMAPRLLIVHQGALGDFIVTFPVLKALRVSFPGIDGICRSSFGHLALDLGVLNHHYSLESRQFASLYTDMIDPGVERLISAYSHILLFSFSPVLEYSMRKIKAARVFRIDPWPAVTHNIQVTEYLIAQVLACGIVSDADGERVKQILHTQQFGRVKKLPPEATIILSPGAGSPVKRWPLERFLNVAAGLKSKGFRPVILLGPAENDIEALLSHHGKPNVDVVSSRNVRELLGVLGAADGFIGNDSGVSHLAAFLGMPVLVIFGPTDPERWRPFGGNVRVVTSSVTCPPCPNVTNTGCREPVCLNQISPDQVLAHMFSAFSPKTP